MAGERTRESYDAVAAEYALHLSDELSYKPLDRALLGLVAEEVAGRPIADVGCGPGHVAGWLAGRGARAVGIDLSPGMVAIASRDHPGVDFRVGDVRELPASDGEFGAAVALYSLIHLEPDDLPVAAAELHRVVAPGGVVLVAFHVGEEVRHVTDWWGHRVDLEFRFLSPDVVSGHLEATGLRVDALVERAPYEQEVNTRRAYLLAHRPVDSRRDDPVAAELAHRVPLVLALVVAAIAVGLDNFGVAIGIGAAHGRSRYRWQVAAVFGVFEAGMPVLGIVAGKAVAHAVAGVAPVIGGVAVGLLGLYTVVSGLRRPPEHSAPGRERLGFGRLLVLGVVLSLDNLAVGFALGSVRVGLALVVIVIGAVSVALSLLGLELGGRLGERAGERGELIGGVALMAVGILIGLGIS